MGMDHPAFTLSALCTVGGILGYARRRSMPTLVGGLTIGALYGVAGYLLKNNKEYGLHTALGASGILLVASLPRAIKTVKPVPVALSTFSLLGLGYFGFRFNQFYLS